MTQNLRQLSSAEFTGSAGAVGQLCQAYTRFLIFWLAMHLFVLFLVYTKLQKYRSCG